MFPRCSRGVSRMGGSEEGDEGRNEELGSDEPGLAFCSARRAFAGDHQHFVLNCQGCSPLIQASNRGFLSSQRQRCRVCCTRGPSYGHKVRIYYVHTLRVTLSPILSPNCKQLQFLAGPCDHFGESKPIIRSDIRCAT